MLGSRGLRCRVRTDLVQTAPSCEELLTTEVDASAAAALREAPPAVQQAVVTQGDITQGANNPSAVLLGRIKRAAEEAEQRAWRANAAPSPANHAILIQLKAGETADLL